VTHLLAKQFGDTAAVIVRFGVDVHLYMNHIDQAKEQMQRTPLTFPTLEVDQSFDSYLTTGSSI